MDDVSHSLVLISRALVAYRLAGPYPVLLPSEIAIDERISAERNKRVGLVRARRLKRLAALAKKKQADKSGTPQVSDDDLLEFLLSVDAEVHGDNSVNVTPPIKF